MYKYIIRTFAKLFKRVLFCNWCAPWFSSGSLAKFDASKELREMTGDVMPSEIEAEQAAKISDHFELAFGGEADDAAAAFWTKDYDSLKTPLTEEERRTLDLRIFPFGGMAEFLQEMATFTVTPNTQTFAFLWQCQMRAAVGVDPVRE